MAFQTISSSISDAESGSNRRDSDWQTILRLMDSKGPYDSKKLRELSACAFAIMEF